MTDDTPVEKVGQLENTGDLSYGSWLGEAERLVVREPGEDGAGPVLEIHADDGMAALEVTDTEFIRGLNKASAELQLELEGPEYV